MKLSIITINLNDKLGLQKTLESLFSFQKFTDFESIIIDGGSTDGSVDVILQKQSKIAYWVSEKDTGIYNAMNKGIKVSKGDYLLFLNSGDYLIDECLGKVFSGNIEEDIVYGDILSIDEKGNTLVHKVKSYYTLFDFMLTSLPHQASFIKRSLFDSYQYSEEYKIVSDWEFFLRKIILEKCTSKYLDYPICIFNTYGITSLPESQKIVRRERENVLRKYFSDRILLDYKRFKTFYSLNEKYAIVLNENISSTFMTFLLRWNSFLIFIYKKLKKCE